MRLKQSLCLVSFS
jgi:hypothetical protein